MREHKYRAWHKELKLLYDIELIDWANKFVVPWNTEDEWEFKDIELMQYIGRKDKKGVALYEENIVTVEGKKTNPYKVWFHDGAFMFDDFTVISNYPNHVLEVIGNTFENNDLLNKGR